MTIADYCAQHQPTGGRYFLTPMGGWPWNAAEAYAGYPQMRNSGLRWLVAIGQNTYLYCEDFRIDTVFLSGTTPFDEWARYPEGAEYDYSAQAQRQHRRKMARYLAALKKRQVKRLTAPIVRVYRPATSSWRVVRSGRTV